VQLARSRGQVWLAATEMPTALKGIMAQPNILVGAGDLERCVAWAIIEGETS
jgi:hypothetical protein